MTLSKKGFVEFLTTRLTKESAKSYLAYVDAFSRAAGKDDKYYFSNLDRANELKELLQGGIDTKPLFLKLSKKFRSNIKTGIRALLKYYLFVQDITTKDVSKIPDGMSQDNILEHYTYLYKQWLKNRVIKLNGDHFKSYEAYSNALRYAIEDSSVTPREFFSYTKKMQIDIFQIQLGDRRVYQGRNTSSRTDMTSSLNKYKLYLAERFGEKSTRLY
jgi:hypothetical protein